MSLDTKLTCEKHEIDRAVDNLSELHCVKIKNVLSKDVLIDTATTAKEIFSTYGHLSKQEQVDANIPYGVSQHMANITMLDENPSKLQYLLIREIYQSHLWEIICKYLKSRDIISLLQISSLRFIDPDQPHLAIPFHQDGFGLPDEKDYMLISVWFLLEPNKAGKGTDVSCVEFLPANINHLLSTDMQTGKKSSYASSSTSKKELEKLYNDGAEVWSPDISIGDCFMFDSYNLHRTGSSLHCNHKRYSAEIRFLACTPETVYEIKARRKNNILEMYYETDDVYKIITPTEINWTDHRRSKFQTVQWEK